jgi:hypothetical protein
MEDYQHSKTETKKGGIFSIIFVIIILLVIILLWNRSAPQPENTVDEIMIEETLLQTNNELTEELNTLEGELLELDTEEVIQAL